MLLRLYRVLYLHGYRFRPRIGCLIALLLCAAALLQGTVPLHTTGAALAASLLLALLTEITLRDYTGSLECWTVTFTSACLVAWPLSHYILLVKLDFPMQANWFTPVPLSAGAGGVLLALVLAAAQLAVVFGLGRDVQHWHGAVGHGIAAVCGALLAVPALGLPLTSSAALLPGIVSGATALAGSRALESISRQIARTQSGNQATMPPDIFSSIAASLLLSAPATYYLLLVLTVPL